MADRSVNININYKVNTADIQKAQAASKAAQAATDNLRKSSKAYGDTATKAGNDAAKAVKGAGDASKKAAKDADDLSKQFGNLSSAVKSFLTLAAVKQIASLGLESVRLAGNVEGVQRAFERAFPNSVKILNDLRTATKGTITDFELMQRTLQATNLGVAVEKLPILFEFAAARAQQTGESVDYLVDSIVRGIGRKSLLILDNLGLSATRLKEQFNGASLASQSVADVTAGVAEIAKAELNKMGGYVETGATKVAKLESAWQNLRIALSKKIEGTVVIGFFTDLADAFTRMTKSEKELTEERAKNTASVQADAVIQSEAYQKAKGNSEEQIRIISLEIVERIKMINIRKKEIEEGEKRRQALIDEGKEWSEQAIRINKVLNNQRLSKQTTEETIEILKRYIIELGGTSAETDNVADSIEALEDKVKELNEQLIQTDKISTPAGIKEARRIKFEIEATQTKIDLIKDQIYWEERLRARREETAGDKAITTSVVDISSDKAMKEFGQQTDFFINETQDIIDGKTKVKPVTLTVTPTIPLDEWDKFEKALGENAGLIAESLSNIASDQAMFSLNADAVMYDERIKQARDFYSDQIELAGDNEQAKSQIRKKEDREIRELTRKRADAEKKAALGGILVNTALGIIKAIATATSIYDGLVKSGVVAVEGASQYAIASKARYYAKGEIDIKGGTRGKDSIPAMLMPGESVMTTAQTFKAKGVLEMVRANKLDDNILKQLQLTGTGVKYVGMSDERIVKAIEKQKFPDLVTVNGMIYEARKSKDGQSKTIRRKSMGNG